MDIQTWACVFLGYTWENGSPWKGDYLVAPLRAFLGVGGIARVRSLQVKEVIWNEADQKDLRFPIREVRERTAILPTTASTFYLTTMSYGKRMKPLSPEQSGAMPPDDPTRPREGQPKIRYNVTLSRISKYGIAKGCKACENNSSMKWMQHVQHAETHFNVLASKKQRRETKVGLTTHWICIQCMLIPTN